MSVKGKTVGGQTGSHAKGTIEEEELRIRVVLELIAEGRPKGEIKKLVASQFGVAPRSVERYHSRALVRLRQETEKSITELRAESFAFYLSVIRNSKASLSDKLKARQRIDKLLGVDVPLKHGPIELIAPVLNEEAGEEKDTRNAVRQIRLYYGLNDRKPKASGGDSSPGEAKESA